MIETLRIKNLVLVDFCEIRFEKGFTIITGETGAGKTALTEGIALILGQRADASLVRKEADKAHIEASFNIENSKQVLSILEEHGLDISLDQPLILTRELSKEGKSRAFINRQAVTLSLLQSIGSHLIDMIGQHSYHGLKSQDTLLQIVDMYGDLKSQVEGFTRTWHLHKLSEKDLKDLSDQMLEKERRYDLCCEQLDELKNAHLQENEELELFNRFSFQASKQDIAARCKEISEGLSEGPRPILKEIAQYKNILNHLPSGTVNCAEAVALLQEALIALQDVDHSLQSILAKIDGDHISTEEIEERLSLYSKIKKKYGATFSDWIAFQNTLNCQIQKWDMLDQAIDEAQERKNNLANQLNQQGQALSIARKQASIKLEQNLSHRLQQMNMPEAKVLLEVSPQARTLIGDDYINAWLQANPGEKPASIKESASGGELSRLLLAIKITLAEKNNTATILFDEIDANVGGTTASLIADQLLELAKHRQVFCITHFPQVAKKGDVHLRVSKQTIDDRTVAKVEHVRDAQRDKELLRMLGGDKLMNEPVKTNP